MKVKRLLLKIKVKSSIFRQGYRLFYLQDDRLFFFFVKNLENDKYSTKPFPFAKVSKDKYDSTKPKGRSTTFS
jgi:hypothetical protein